MSEPSPAAVSAVSMQSRAARGGLVSGVAFALNLGLNLVQVPLLLRLWPQETYGLWLSVGALATLLTSLDGGHQAYVGNLISRDFVEDRLALRRTLASAVRIAAVTATLQILLTLLLCGSGLAARWLDIGDQHTVDFGLAVAIYTIGWISTGSVGAILVRLFLPTGHFVRSTWWGIAARVVQFAAVGAAAWLGWGLVGTALLFAGTVFVYNVALFADIRRLYPEWFPWWQGGDIHRGFRNFLRSNVVTGVNVLDLLSLQGVVLLVTGTLGAAVVPLFTTLRTLANTAMQGTGFLLNPIQPDLVRYHVRREGGKVRGVFGFYWLSTGAIINGGMIAGLFFVEPLYTFWTRGKLPFDRSLFSWLAAAVLVRTLSAPWQNYLSANNELSALTVTAVVRASFTLGGVLVLVPVWGLAGVCVALFAAEFAGSVLCWRFVARIIAGHGSESGSAAAGLALLSTGLSCGVIFAFAQPVTSWPWLAGLVLVALGAIAVAQWRGLAPEVRTRARSLVPPTLAFWRLRLPAR